MLSTRCLSGKEALLEFSASGSLCFPSQPRPLGIPKDPFPTETMTERWGLLGLLWKPPDLAVVHSLSSVPSLPICIAFPLCYKKSKNWVAMVVHSCHLRPLGAWDGRIQVSDLVRPCLKVKNYKRAGDTPPWKGPGFSLPVWWSREGACEARGPSMQNKLFCLKGSAKNKFIRLKI